VESEDGGVRSKHPQVIREKSGEPWPFGSARTSEKQGG
jgi:hypothetical protein